MTRILPEIARRRSVRAYQSTPVSQEDLLCVLEAARLAPSGNNRQPWKFLVIRNEETKRAIVSAENGQDWMLSAPVFIVCMGDLRARTGHGEDAPVTETHPDFEVKRIVRDSSIAITHMMLQAEHLGLSTCWTGWYTQAALRAVLDLPNEFFITGVLTLGYAAEEPAPRPRQALEDLVRFERWE